MASVKLLPKSSNPAARKPYKLRYWDTAGQHERSFVTAKERKDFAVRFEHDQREQSYIDPKQGDVTFSEYAAKWLAGHVCAPQTRHVYDGTIRNHLGGTFGATPLRKITREQVKDLLLVELASKLGLDARQRARVVITSVLSEAVKSKRITDNVAKGIRLPAKPDAAKFTMPTGDQIETLKAGLPAEWRFTVDLMTGCGLRVSEALAVRDGSFRDAGTVLRVGEQVLSKTREIGPLKWRKPGEFRDVPVPAWVLEASEGHPGAGIDGYLFRDLTDRGFVHLRRFERAFANAASAAGLPDDFTPHDLRHVWASVALAAGLPVTDVSRWLGHRSVNTTYKTYSHFIPSSFDRAREVLDAQHRVWA